MSGWKDSQTQLWTRTPQRTSDKVLRNKIISAADQRAPKAWQASTKFGISSAVLLAAPHRIVPTSESQH
jgi:hypothetical protein